MNNEDPKEAGPAVEHSPNKFCVNKTELDTGVIKVRFDLVAKMFRNTLIELDHYNSKLSKVHRLKHILNSLSISYDLELTINNLRFQEEMLIHDRDYYQRVVNISLKKLFYDVYYVNKKISDLCKMIKEVNIATASMRGHADQIGKCKPLYDIFTKNQFTLVDIEKIFDETCYNINILDRILEEFKVFIIDLNIQGETGIEVGNLNLSVTTQFNKLMLEYNRQITGMQEIISFHFEHLKTTLKGQNSISGTGKHYRNQLSKLVQMVYRAHKAKRGQGQNQDHHSTATTGGVFIHPKEISTETVSTVESSHDTETFKQLAEVEKEINEEHTHDSLSVNTDDEDMDRTSEATMPRRMKNNFNKQWLIALAKKGGKKKN